MNGKPSRVWFRRDLRLSDNPALLAACARGGPVIPIYVASPLEDGLWAPGAASRWWLHHSLAAFDGSLAARGSRLIIRGGASIEVLLSLADELEADAVYWNRLYEPAALRRDHETERALRTHGLATASFNSSLLFEPSLIRNNQDRPFQVFTPFWRRCQETGEPGPAASAPRRIPAPRKWPRSVPLPDLDLLPRHDWAIGLRKIWTPGEHGARASLRRFLEKRLSDYPAGRDRPAEDLTSRLSPHLHFGEISPQQVWSAAVGRSEQRAAGAYLRQIGWREFAHHLLFHFPHTATKPLRPEYAAFPWRRDPASLRAWQEGRTGYPLVDAGIRQLWQTGWMHNRVRMVVASFLVKDLLLPWQEGAKWFWDTLVDADLANNTLGWQWAAGCGADAAPYFRVFNPVLQGERFDAKGAYVRRWVPELARLPDRWIHKPWMAPQKILSEAGVELGRTYPKLLVDHAAARDRALEAFGSLREKAANVAKRA